MPQEWPISAVIALWRSRARRLEKATRLFSIFNSRNDGNFLSAHGSSTLSLDADCTLFFFIIPNVIPFHFISVAFVKACLLVSVLQPQELVKRPYGQRGALMRSRRNRQWEPSVRPHAGCTFCPDLSRRCWTLAHVSICRPVAPHIKMAWDGWARPVLFIYFFIYF